MTHKHNILTLLALSAMTAMSPHALAQSDSDKEQEQTESKPEEPKKEAEPFLPDLDELLGLEEPGDDESDSSAADAVEALDPNRAELDRALDDEDVSEAFVQAVKQMGDAANLLQRAGDPGLQTQRVQDEIIRRLEILIENAQQQSSQSSSSSQTQQQQQQQQSPPSQQQQQAQNKQDSKSTDSNPEAQPPGGRDGPLANRIDTAQAAWGALPERVRQVLLEGVSDQFSSMYQRMTEDYYRRLAEEASDQ